MKKALEGCSYIALDVLGSSGVAVWYLQPVESSHKYHIYMCMYLPYDPFDLFGTVLGPGAEK